jgi:hypothetical protein
MKVDIIARQKLMEEIERLVDQGFDREVVEENFLDFMSGIGGKAVTQTVKGQMMKFVLDKLGIVDSDSFMGLALRNTFANLEFKDYGKLGDCAFVTPLLTKTILETFIDKMRVSAGMDSILFTALKETLTEAGANTEAFKSLEGYVASFICPIVKQIADTFDLSAFTGK